MDHPPHKKKKKTPPPKKKKKKKKGGNILLMGIASPLLRPVAKAKARSSAERKKGLPTPTTDARGKKKTFVPVRRGGEGVRPRAKTKSSVTPERRTSSQKRKELNSQGKKHNFATVSGTKRGGVVREKKKKKKEVPARLGSALFSN